MQLQLRSSGELIITQVLLVINDKKSLSWISLTNINDI